MLVVTEGEVTVLDGPGPAVTGCEGVECGSDRDDDERERRFGMPAGGG